MPPKQQSGKGQAAASSSKAPPGADQQGDMSAGQKGKRQTLKNLPDKVQSSALGCQALAKVSGVALKVRSRRPTAAAACGPLPPQPVLHLYVAPASPKGRRGAANFAHCAAPTAAGGGCRAADSSGASYWECSAPPAGSAAGSACGRGRRGHRRAETDPCPAGPRAGGEAAASPCGRAAERPRRAPQSAAQAERGLSGSGSRAGRCCRVRPAHAAGSGRAGLPQVSPSAAHGAARRRGRGSSSGRSAGAPAAGQRACGQR